MTPLRAVFLRDLTEAEIARLPASDVARALLEAWARQDRLVAALDAVARAHTDLRNAIDIVEAALRQARVGGEE